MVIGYLRNELMIIFDMSSCDILISTAQAYYVEFISIYPDFLR